MPTPNRLPIVASDDGVWGDIIRQYLLKEHYDDGTDNAANGGHKNVTIRAGISSAGGAPLTLTTGTLLITPEAGAIEFAGDHFYLTSTTGPVRRKIAAYDDTSGATGDIYYRSSGGTFTRLGVGSSNNVLTISGGLPTWQAPATTTTFTDSTFTIQDDGDATKQVKFQASSISTGTTRTITIPNANGTMYVSSGTDVAVADGGTGRSTSTTAYGIIAAGTTATGAQQTIAPGTSGQFLKSAGASALGSFAAITAADFTGTKAQFNTALTDGDFVFLDSNDTISGNKVFTGDDEFTKKLFTKEIWVTPTAGPGTTATFTLDNSSGQVWQNTNNAAGSWALWDQTNSTAPIIVQPDSIDQSLLINEVGAIVKDDYFNIADTTYNKSVKFSTSSISALTTRTLTVPDASTTIVGTDATQTLTNKTIAAGSNTITGLGVAALGGITGTANSTTYLRGDGTWSTITAGDVSSNTATSVDSEIALFNSTTGKSIKRASGTGIAKLTSGVLSTVAAPSGAIVGDTDTQTLTNKTLTAPRVDSLKDTNGNAVLDLWSSASAVNNLVIQNKAAGTTPTIASTGTDTDIGIALVPQGTGTVQIYADTGVTPGLVTTGVDTDVDLNLGTKGAGKVKANNVEVVTISSTQTLTNKNMTSGTNTWPTFNQNTTGSAAKLTTTRTFQTNLASTSAVSFDGTTNNSHGVTGTLPVGNGGTGATTLTGIVKGNGTGAFTAVTAPSGTIVGTTDTQTLTNKTIAAGSNTITGLGVAALGGITGTANSTTYLRGDGTWAAISTGDASTNTASSVDSEVVLFSGTGGKTLKRASGTGLAKLTSGVLGTATAGTDYVTPTGTETLTNKRVTRRVGTTTSSATPAINTDNYDQYTITALATNITSMTSSLSGTPVDGQKLIVRIKDNGSARSITWGASWRGIGVTLPATTTIVKPSILALSTTELIQSGMS